jgi:ribosomal protein S19
MKSKWKLNYFSLYLNNCIEYTKNRNYPINSSLLNKIIHVHNGKNYYKIVITKDMLLKKLGVFFKTKKKHIFKSKKKKRK